MPFDRVREYAHGHMDGTPVDPDAPRDLGTVAEEVNEAWLRGAMDRLQAGREIPIRDIPASTGEMGHMSDIQTAQLYRKATTRSYTVHIDIRAMEAKRRMREAAVKFAEALSGPGEM